MQSWTLLDAHRSATAQRPILELFAADPGRAAGFSLEVPSEGGAMVLDYSRTAIDARARALLLSLVAEAGLPARREGMFAGANINTTEDRAALHVALRDVDGGPLIVGGEDVTVRIRATLSRMEAFATAVREGLFRASSGPFDAVINVGIGGSDLGPALVTEALSPWTDGPKCHFLSNVDGAHAAQVTAACDPRRTLVIVASKTFTTVETMTNAATLRDWMAAGGGDPSVQFAALSSDLARTAAFGIPPDRVFGFSDWVGGRFSVWGPIGLSAMIALGPARFRAFLSGAREMDRHFRTAPAEANMPVLLALTGLWHAQVCGYPTRAVLPYDQHLARLPAYLQQLEMESNGKSVDHAGEPLARGSSPVVWGAPGTNGQHAFMQALHQGCQVIPAEFLLAAAGGAEGLAPHHRLLAANCLAQAEALMRGRDLVTARARLEAAGLRGETLEVQARHRVFPGNRPSVMLLYPRLTPHVLGQLLALYEHRVFVEGVVLGLNSFDQWGVELGKEIATRLLPHLENAAAPLPTGLDPATAHSISYLRRYGQG